MNEAYIRALQPGPLLDALVAQHIFRWNVFPYMTRQEMREGPPSLCPPGQRVYIGNIEEPFEYSTDWDKTRLVVEELAKRDRVITMKADGIRRIDAPMYTVLVDNVDSRVDCHSLPHAVCIAALLSVTKIEVIFL